MGFLDLLLHWFTGNTTFRCSLHTVVIFLEFGSKGNRKSDTSGRVLWIVVSPCPSAFVSLVPLGASETVFLTCVVFFVLSATASFSAAP
jgi:hypothetical protein